MRQSGTVGLKKKAKAQNGNNELRFSVADTSFVQRNYSRGSKNKHCPGVIARLHFSGRSVTNPSAAPAKGCFFACPQCRAHKAHCCARGHRPTTMGTFPRPCVCTQVVCVSAAAMRKHLLANKKASDEPPYCRIDTRTRLHEEQLRNVAARGIISACKKLIVYAIPYFAVDKISTLFYNKIYPNILKQNLFLTCF